MKRLVVASLFVLPITAIGIWVVDWYLGLLRLPESPPIVRVPSLKKEPPPASLDCTGVKPNLKYKQEYTFRTDWFSDDIPVWTKALEPFRGKAKIRYLEVGVFEGRSLFWALENIFTDPSSELVGIDPFIEEEGVFTTDTKDFKKVFYKNLELSGAANRIKIIEGFSQVELRYLKEPFDVIYIDGSHSAQDVLEDAIQCKRLLKEGGLLIFDDYGWPGVHKAVDTWYDFFHEDLEVLHKEKQVIFRLKKHGVATKW